MSKEQRVVITGVGALSPLGNDAKTSWDNALKVLVVLIILQE